MKLIDDFAQRLDAGTLPERFTDWWIVEDADRDFEEHPFDKDPDYDWMAIPSCWVWEDFQRRTPISVDSPELRPGLRNRRFGWTSGNSNFPEKLIDHMKDLYWRQKRIDEEVAELPARIAELEKEVADKKEYIARMKDRIKPGMSDAQIKGAFPRLEWDDNYDEQSFVWD